MQVVGLTVIVLSAKPGQNHLFPGSNATDRTHPKWPLMTCITEIENVFYHLVKTKMLS